MTSLFSSPRRAAPFVLAAALASTSAMTLAPSAALAVPAGGYADLVEQISPAVVFKLTSPESISLTDITPPRFSSMF